MTQRKIPAAGWKAALDRLLPGYARLPLLMTVLWNCLVYYGSNLIAGDWPHHEIALAIDGAIPLVPWTALIYLGCYLFWIVNYILAARQSKEAAYRFLSAEFLAKTVCFLIFIVYPTTCVRPEIPPAGFWNRVILGIYQVDAPVNLFPSIHCLVSWFCYLGIRKQEQIPRWYRRFSFWFALAVFVSTLTTKQHVIADVAGGVILASICYRITVPCGFAGIYTRFFDWRKGRKTERLSLHE